MTEADELFLKPAAGRSVRREDGAPWPIHGDWTPATQYVRRRLADADLVKADPEEAARAVAAEAEAAARAEAEAAAAAAAAAEGSAQAPAEAVAPAPVETAQDASRKNRRAAAADE